MREYFEDLDIGPPHFGGQRFRHRAAPLWRSKTALCLGFPLGLGTTGPAMVATRYHIYIWLFITCASVNSTNTPTRALTYRSISGPCSKPHKQQHQLLINAHVKWFSVWFRLVQIFCSEPGGAARDPLLRESNDPNPSCYMTAPRSAGIGFPSHSTFYLLLF